jgi:hypothetical protein
MNALPKITERFSNRYQVTQGNCIWYFSYSTCVAFERFDPEAPATERFTRIRRQSHYSRTTAKHMGQMGVAAWAKVDDVTFEKIAGRAP